MRRLTFFGFLPGVALIGSTFLASAQVNPAAHLNAAALNPVQPMARPQNMPAYGNVLFPGGNPSFPSQLGATVRGTPYGYGPGVVGGGGYPGGHIGRPRTVVVPYAVPAYYGGYGYGGYGSGYDPYVQQQQPSTNVTVVVPQQPAPSVIINQTFNTGEPVSRELREVSADTPAEGGLKSWEPKRSGSPAPHTTTASAGGNTTAAEERSYARDGKPTIYLIAMKDSSVQQAIGFWLEGSNLAYVTPEANIHRVSIEKVDRDRSVQLNAERKLDFDIRSR